MGSVNKVSLFDKDVMVLVIYGLRGFNHEGEVAVCLKCAYDIKEACCSLDGVYSVSIGVTTGTAYCGVVGHPLRREYTVMGPVVNKAARLMCNYPGKKALLLSGPPRIGKTRLLDEMILEAYQKGFQPIVIVLHNVHSTMAYGTAQYIIKQILEIPDSASVDDKEDILSRVLENHAPLSDFWYLNEVMNVKFPKATNISSESAPKFEKIKKLFQIILTFGTKSMLLTIDDIEYCDELSWKLIMSIIDSRIKFLIMTMPSRLKPEVARVLIFPPEVEAHISRLTLKGLTPDSLATLACQILNTRAIPVELERVLILKSNGNPGWCERYLISLTQSNVLKVLEIPIWQIKSLGMIIPNENKLIREQLQHFDNRPSEMAHERQGSFDNVTESTEDKENEKDKLSKQASVHKVVKEKGISHFSETYQYRRSNLLNVEDAYEDFRQRIQLVRKLPKLLTDRGKSLHDLREYSERNLNTKEKVKTLTFEDERKHVNYRESITRKMKLAEQAQNESDGLPVHGKASEILEGTSGPVIDEPLKRVISEIHWRFKKSSQPVTVGYQLVRDNKIVLRSLTDVRDIEMARPMVSKSAENFINRSQPFKCKVETEEKLLHAIYQSNEYPPSILWKTYTQQLVEDSVKIFIRKKTTEAAMSKKKKLIVRDGNRNLSAGNVRRQIQSADLSTRELALAQNKDIKMDLKARERLFNGKGRRKDSIELAQDKSRLDRKGEPSSTKVEENKLLQNRAYRISLLFNKNEHQSRTHHHILSKAQEKRKSRVLNLFKGFKPRTDIRQSPTESYVDITNELEDNNETISAVLINPKVNIEEVTSPECFVGIIMSAFDCLGPYEQLLLKCGSVLGEKFSRKMLNIIMHNPNPYITAEAMKRLFEMRILCCGSDPNEYNPTDVCKCLCPLQITDIIDDTLPDYSYCHVLVFVYSGFRSTLYELIPLDQKREFHIRAVEFLEKEQIYCSSCAKLNRILTSASFDDHSISTQSGVSMRSSSRRKTSASEGRDSTTFVPKEDEKDQSTLLLPNILPSFQKCECLVLKADALKQLIDHSVSAGLKKKEFEFVTNYCSILIALGEFDEARKLLGEMESKLKETFENSVKRSERKLMEGRLQLLLGYLSLETGALKKAYMHLMNALNHFGSKFIPLFPFESFQYLHEYIIQNFRHNNNVSAQKDKFIGQQDFTEICLSLLSNVFMMQEKWALARTVGLRSLNNLRSKDDNFIELCNSYSNIIDIYRHFGQFKACRKFEVDISKSCIANFQYKTALELVAVGRLNCSILNTRIISGYLNIAARLGEYALKISQNVSFYTVESYIISQVAQVKMMIGKLNKAAVLIIRLPVQDIWYHILSLDFALETGFLISSPEQSLDFITNSIFSGRILDNSLKRRAISVIYVWLSRTRRFEEADMWYKRMPSPPHTPVPGDTINSMVTIVKILEGDMLTLSFTKMHDPTRYSALYKKVTMTIKALDKSTKKTEFIIPRFLHLKAFHFYLLNNFAKAMAIMRKASRICHTHGNILEQTWIEHNLAVWSSTENFDKEYWINSVKFGKLIKWCESHSKLSWKKYMYTLDYYHT
ncbi:UNVERIFIED_CONTAM: hypothetical protein PYX00_003531 [Menopon gallinae]|uniref:Guanylate cyclase domain-containing protein n=1 Tax=Menopon gallinae TaxID=328185 RepID=A0AAW2I0B0_9NEOP